MAVERSTRSEALTDLSASRINTVHKCALLFDYQYRQRIPNPVDSASSIFGTVIHVGIQEWYGGPGPRTSDNAEAHRDLKLPDLVVAQWPEHLPPKIWEEIEHTAELDGACEELASFLVAKHGYKAPRQTKLFLGSAEWKAFNAQVIALVERCNNYDAIHWPRNENAYQAYRKALDQARLIEGEWRDLPRPLLVEEPFRLTIEGVTLRGQVDQVREDPNPSGEPQPQRIRDIKTGKQVMTQMEAFWQAWIYNEAVNRMDYDFLRKPILDFDFYLTRHVGKDGRIKRQEGRIDRERHKALALEILHEVIRKIERGDRAPNYGHHCKLCDYRDYCAQHIDLWVGDGLEGD